MNFDIAVVIPAFNEERAIDHTLNEFTREADERTILILIDNGSTDGTLRTVKHWQTRHPNHPFTVLFEKRNGALYARRRGMWYAKDIAECVISVDADDRPLPGFYDHIRQDFLRNPQADILRGRIRHDPQIRLLRQLYLPQLMRLISMQEAIETELFGPFFFGGYFGVKRALINELAFPIRKIPAPEEASVYWSRHCVYLGYRFQDSRPDMRSSNRRFWADPYASSAGARLQPIRTELTSVKKQERFFRELAGNEPELIRLRKQYFARRILLFLLDAAWFLKASVGNPRAKEAVMKTSAFLNIDGAHILDLSALPFKEAQKEILVLYERRARRTLDRSDARFPDRAGNFIR